jgi:hypothetical protein
MRRIVEETPNEWIRATQWSSDESRFLKRLDDLVGFEPIVERKDTEIDAASPLSASFNWVLSPFDSCFYPGEGIRQFSCPLAPPVGSCLKENLALNQVLNDPNWLLSTTAQSAAALVAIVGSFLVSRVISLVGQRESLEHRLDVIDGERERLARTMPISKRGSPGSTLAGSSMRPPTGWSTISTYRSRSSSGSVTPVT